MFTIRFKLKPLCAVLCLSPGLVMAENTLNNIVVTANNTEQTQRSVTANMQVITREDIETRQYQTLADALKSIPGISAYSNGGLGSSTSVFMRGMDSKNILVLVDGVAVNEPSSLSGANFNHILLSQVERIEVVKGPQSGVWGADAVAGVINIITTQAKPHTHVHTQLEVGSNAYRQLGAQLGSGNEQVDFMFTFNNTRTDGFSAVRAYKQSAYDFEADPFNQTDIGFKMGVNFTPNQRLQVNIQSSNATTHYDGTTTPNAQNAIDFSSQIRQLQYRGQFDQIGVKAALQETKITRDYQPVNSTFDSQVIASSVALNYRYMQNHLVELAFNNKQQRNENNSQSFYNTGIGLTNTNQFNNGNLIFTQALRSDHFDKYDDKVTGKIGVKNYFTDAIFVSANYGTGYRAPNLSESAYSRLKPESTEAHDITLGAYGLDLTYFHQKTDNKITYVSGWPITHYRNTAGKSTFEGVEAVFKHQIQAIQTDVNLSYTHLSAKDKDGKWFARQPEQQASLTLDYYGIHNTRLGLQTRYMGKAYDQADKKRAQIGDYFVTDLTADYQITPHVTLFGKVQNLFDEDYISAVASYVSATNDTPRFVYSNGGRMFFIGVKAAL